jgi:hypothetical protein
MPWLFCFCQREKRIYKTDIDVRDEEPVPTTPGREDVDEQNQGRKRTTDSSFATESVAFCSRIVVATLNARLAVPETAFVAKSHSRSFRTTTGESVFS